jgi:hypothetical protein
VIAPKAVRLVPDTCAMPLTHEREKKGTLTRLANPMPQECKGSLRAAYARSHPEKSSKGCGNPEELDGDLGSPWSERIASQPFFPRESVVGSLATREQRRVRC